MLSQSAKFKLMFEVMENSLLRKHNYMQILLATKKLVDSGANYSWFNFEKFVAYESPIEQLSVFEKEMLFRNFYSYERVALYIYTWYKHHEHLIKAFRTQKGWNESEFYFNLNETVDTPVSMLNAYRDFMLLTHGFYFDKPKFYNGLPNDFNAPDRDIASMFLETYEATINEGLVTHTTSRLSDSKFSKMSPLFISGPVQLNIKDRISNAVNTGRHCVIANKQQSDDPFKVVFGSDFHNLLPDLFNKLISKMKEVLTERITSGFISQDDISIHHSYLLDGINDLILQPFFSLIKNNKELFSSYLLKYLNAGNKNITKQSMLNKLAIFVHAFNMIANAGSFVSIFVSRYRNRNLIAPFYLIDKGESDDVSFTYYPDSYIRPNFLPTVSKDNNRRNNGILALIRVFYLLDTLDYNSFMKWSYSSVIYTSVTVSKVRSNGRYSVRNSKVWNNFITDLNEYLNFRSDTKNFLINLHPCATLNASLGYGGWSSCHSSIDLPTGDMLKYGKRGNQFPSGNTHSFWAGNYQLTQGNAFVITEPPFLVKEKQWLIPNKVRTFAWVAEDFSSIRMNLPYPEKQTGDISDEMYLEYTAIRERMAAIFKPFVSIPEPHTWVRVSSNGMNSKDIVAVPHQGNTFYSDVKILNPDGTQGNYDGFSGESLQSCSILKELVATLPNQTSYLIHSSDYLVLNNEKLLRPSHNENLAEVNAYDYSYDFTSNVSSRTFISKYSRVFNNHINPVTDYFTGLPFNKDYMFYVEGGDYISYSTYLLNKDKFFYCEDTKQFSTDALKVYVDKGKNFVYFSKAFTGAQQCSVSKEFFLPSLMVDGVSIFELMKRSQVEWSFVVDDFVKRNLVFVYDDVDSLNNFLDTLSKKTTYRWASGKLPNEYHFDTTKAIVFADGVLKLKSIDDLDGFKIVDVKNLLFKS